MQNDPKKLAILVNERGFLRDLAGRLTHVPVMYGVDQSDIDHLLDIGRMMMEIEDIKPIFTIKTPSGTIEIG